VKRLILVQNGWPCTLQECPPGPFLFHGNLCHMTEYSNNEGKRDAYCETGEYFWGGTSEIVSRSKLKVQPLTAFWETYDE